jgi:phi LC3 family holin
MINWKLRFKNKTTLVTLLLTIIAAVYSILAALGITPSITQEQVTDLVMALVSVLAALGIVVDPTTEGIGDSARAMLYDEPYPSDKY